MKTYRFDYIREMVDKWNPNIPRTVEQIEFTPWLVTLPWIMPDDFRPAKDYYGEVVEDITEWKKQRHEFCVKLADEYAKS